MKRCPNCNALAQDDQARCNECQTSLRNVAIIDYQTLTAQIRRRRLKRKQGALIGFIAVAALSLLTCSAVMELDLTALVMSTAAGIIIGLPVGLIAANKV